MRGTCVQPESEITLEANPAAMTFAQLQALREGGFNRISMGVQSASDRELQTLGRRHSFAQAQQSVQMAQAAGFRNVSVDLMLGTPGQTAQAIDRFVETFDALGVQHISGYLLKIEPGTPFARQHIERDCPDEERSAELYLHTVEQMARHGFLQYEVSNFARPGFESRHNLKYWTGGEYVGFGPGAHSYFGGRRYAYPRDLEGYIRAVAAGNVPLEDCQTITATEQAREYLLLQMRTLYGIEEWEYRRLFGLNFDPIARRLEVLESHRWVEQSGHRWHFTPQGFLLSNTLILDLLEAQSATLQVKKDWKAFLGPPDDPPETNHP